MLRLLALAAASVPLACGGSSTQPEKDASGRIKLRVQLNWVPEPEFGGLYAALENGHYEAAGLSVELIKGSAGVPSAQLVANGKVELAVVTADEIIKLRAQGAPIVGVYAQFLRSPRGIVVHESSPHSSLEALWKSDARVVLEPGQAFAKWLDHRFAGTRLERVPSTGSLAAFLDDPALAQAVYVFAEPVELARRGTATRILDVADSGFNPYEAVLATYDGFARANPQVVRGFIDATRKGWADYLSDPGSTNAVMVGLNPAMSRESMDTAAELIRPYVHPEGATLGTMTLDRWTTLIEQLGTIGAIDPGRAPEPKALFLQ
jgi:NitT/TauT family transport system substrate-binding protein